MRSVEQSGPVPASVDIAMDAGLYERIPAHAIGAGPVLPLTGRQGRRNYGHR